MTDFEILSLVLLVLAVLITAMKKKLPWSRRQFVLK